MCLMGFWREHGKELPRVIRAFSELIDAPDPEQSPGTD